MKRDFPKNRQELLAELIALGEKTLFTDDKIIFLSLAYLLNELVPEDRTTEKVFMKGGMNMENETQESLTEEESSEEDSE